MSFVTLFTTNNFLEDICDQSNLYASRVISAALCSFTNHSQLQTWTPVSVSELKTILGVDISD
jgi:hypothetical protein